MSNQTKEQKEAEAKAALELKTKQEAEKKAALELKEKKAAEKLAIEKANAEALKKTNELEEAKAAKLKAEIEIAETKEEKTILQTQLDALKAKLFGKEETKSSEKEAVQIFGSVNKKYKVPVGEEDLVHCVLVNHASPRSKDLTKEHKPHTRILKTAPHNFVAMFANNYTENDAMQNVTTPGRIVAIFNNLNKELVGELFADEIQSATKGAPRQRGAWIERKLDQFDRLRVAGGNQMVSKDGIFHIPTDDKRFPFDPKELKAFPEDCLY